MIDFIADYLENIRERDVFPRVQPGFLVSALPDDAPQEGEAFEDIFKDVESLIMPGVRRLIILVKLRLFMFIIYLSFHVSDYALAKSIHACLFPCSE